MTTPSLYLQILIALRNTTVPMTLPVIVSTLRLQGLDVSTSQVDNELKLADGAEDLFRVVSKHGVVSATITPEGRVTLRNENL